LSNVAGEFDALETVSVLGSVFVFASLISGINLNLLEQYVESCV